MTNQNTIIEETQSWLQQIVVALNFCPFAKKEMHARSIHYQVVNADDFETALTELIQACKILDQDDDLTTALVIYPQGFEQFDRYLDLLDLANALLIEEDYEGVYQLASFHPDYCFEGEPQDDPANYTNRSPYPILHILKESVLEQALQSYPDPESIPEQNIQLAREKGREYFEMMLKSL